MSIYFGSTGFIELKRDALNSEISTSINPADVNTSKKRFSVEKVNGSLITGDQVEIETVDGSNLELLANHSFPDLRKYIHIDDMGGIKLYNTFASALAGGLVFFFLVDFFLVAFGVGAGQTTGASGPLPIFSDAVGSTSSHL
jgi:hypothetical protein